MQWGKKNWSPSGRIEWLKSKHKQGLALGLGIGVQLCLRCRACHCIEPWGNMSCRVDHNPSPTVWQALYLYIRLTNFMTWIRDVKVRMRDWRVQTVPRYSCLPAVQRSLSWNWNWHGWLYCWVGKIQANNALLIQSSQQLLPDLSRVKCDIFRNIRLQHSIPCNIVIKTVFYYSKARMKKQTWLLSIIKSLIWRWTLPEAPKSMKYFHRFAMKCTALSILKALKVSLNSNWMLTKCIYLKCIFYFNGLTIFFCHFLPHTFYFMNINLDSISFEHFQFF